MALAGRLPDPLRMRAAWRDLVLGEACVGCSRRGVAICLRCLTVAVRVGPVGRVGGTTDAGAVAVYAAGRYDSALGPLLVHLKERGRLTLLDPAARCLAEAVAVATPRFPAVLVPVPSSADAIAKRHLDHTWLLAGRAAQLLRAVGLPTIRRALLGHRGGNRNQAGLTAAARRANVAGVFYARGPQPASHLGHVVVVDDVWTTGATAGAAVTALARTGVAPSGVAVVAAVPPPERGRRFGQGQGPGSRQTAVD